MRFQLPCSLIIADSQVERILKLDTVVEIENSKNVRGLSTAAGAHEEESLASHLSRYAVEIPQQAQEGHKRPRKFYV